MLVSTYNLLFVFIIKCSEYQETLKEVFSKEEIKNRLCYLIGRWWIVFIQESLLTNQLFFSVFHYYAINLNHQPIYIFKLLQLRRLTWFIYNRSVNDIFNPLSYSFCFSFFKDHKLKVELWFKKLF